MAARDMEYGKRRGMVRRGRWIYVERRGGGKVGKKKRG